MCLRLLGPAVEAGLDDSDIGVPSLLRFCPRDSSLLRVFSLSEFCELAGDCPESGVCLKRAISFVAWRKTFMTVTGRPRYTRFARVVALAIAPPEVLAGLLRQRRQANSADSS